MEEEKDKIKTIEEIREKIPIDCDLSITSFFSLLYLLEFKFKIKPQYLTVRVSIEQSLNVESVKRYINKRLSYLGFYRMFLLEPENFKLLYGIKYIGFTCDRDLAKDYWEISCLKNGILYIVFSEGT